MAVRGVRITGGEARGRRLRVPRGRAVRPTSDRVREALFNVLGPVVRGRCVADLFAGSGALGLEALSRGAAFVTFVERERRVAEVLLDNVRALGYESRSRLLREDVFRTVPNTVGRMRDGLVLADPPYARGLAALLVQVVARHAAPGSRLVIEHRRDEGLPGAVEGVPEFCRVDERQYGDTAISYYRHAAEEGQD